MKPSKPIRKVSKKRAKQLREYGKKRAAFLEGRNCAICMEGGGDLAWVIAERTQSGRATEVHHKRGRIGEMLNREEYWLPVCSYHHRKIHEFPSWARANAYLA